MCGHDIVKNSDADKTFSSVILLHHHHHLVGTKDSPEEQ
jgi:hypothetical protein